MLTSKISTFRSALLVAALAFAPLTASLHAQATDEVRVNVPFAFQNGSQVLPAGAYILIESNHVLTIRGSKDAGMSQTRIEDDNSRSSGPSKLVFQRYGDKYFLREVWVSGRASHTVCVLTREEMNAHKAVAQMQVASAASTSSAQTIEVAAVMPSR